MPIEVIEAMVNRIIDFIPGFGGGITRAAHVNLFQAEKANKRKFTSKEVVMRGLVGGTMSSFLTRFVILVLINKDILPPFSEGEKDDVIMFTGFIIGFLGTRLIFYFWDKHTNDRNTN